MFQEELLYKCVSKQLKIPKDLFFQLEKPSPKLAYFQFQSYFKWLEVFLEETIQKFKTNNYISEDNQMISSFRSSITPVLAYIFLHFSSFPIPTTEKDLDQAKVIDVPDVIPPRSKTVLFLQWNIEIGFHNDYNPYSRFLFEIRYIDLKYYGYYITQYVSNVIHTKPSLEASFQVNPNELLSSMLPIIKILNTNEDFSTHKKDFPWWDYCHTIANSVYLGNIGYILAQTLHSHIKTSVVKALQVTVFHPQESNLSLIQYLDQIFQHNIDSYPPVTKFRPSKRNHVALFKAVRRSLNFLFKEYLTSFWKINIIRFYSIPAHPIYHQTYMSKLLCSDRLNRFSSQIVSTSKSFAADWIPCLTQKAIFLVKPLIQLILLSYCRFVQNSANQVGFTQKKLKDFFEILQIMENNMKGIFEKGMDLIVKELKLRVNIQNDPLTDNYDINFKLCIPQ